MILSQETYLFHSDKFSVGGYCGVIDVDEVCILFIASAVWRFFIFPDNYEGALRYVRINL